MTPEESMLKAKEVGRCINDEVLPQLMAHWPEFSEGQMASFMIGWGFSVLCSNDDKESITKNVASINDMLERLENSK